MQNRLSQHASVKNSVLQVQMDFPRLLTRSSDRLVQWTRIDGIFQKEVSEHIRGTRSILGIHENNTPQTYVITHITPYFITLSLRRKLRVFPIVNCEKINIRIYNNKKQTRPQHM